MVVTRLLISTQSRLDGHIVCETFVQQGYLCHVSECLQIFLLSV